jgi:hypothetical protein
LLAVADRPNYNVPDSNFSPLISASIFFLIVGIQILKLLSGNLMFSYVSIRRAMKYTIQVHKLKGIHADIKLFLHAGFKSA